MLQRVYGTAWESAEQLAAYQNGDFTFVGVRAEAEVVIEGVVQTLTSGGMWGVESDSKEYIEEVAVEEYAALREILTSIGVSTSQVPVGDKKTIQISWEA